MSARPRIFCVVAARPNFMKVAPILDEIERRGSFEAVLVHTGQHYDRNMSDVFFQDLGIRDPDVHLGFGSGTHAEQTGHVLIAFERLCLEDRPDGVLVVGDVNATMACSLAAAKLHIPVAHVEAGLRSGDRRMPEELNRIVTDQLSDLLLTTSRDANQNLEREGIAAEKIHFTGNVMVDSLLNTLEHLETAALVSLHLSENFLDSGYGLLTLHRPSNVDDPAVLGDWVKALEEISRFLPLVSPVHPRTRSRLEEFDLTGPFERAVLALPPLGYQEFIALQKHSLVVITDSGGVQEESTVLGIPCLTLRENTERPVTIDQGTNMLIGIDPGKLVREARRVAEASGNHGSRCPEFWDGKAASRIVDVLEQRWAQRESN